MSCPFHDDCTWPCPRQASVNAALAMEPSPVPLSRYRAKAKRGPVSAASKDWQGRGARLAAARKRAGGPTL